MRFCRHFGLSSVPENTDELYPASDKVTERRFPPAEKLMSQIFTGNNNLIQGRVQARQRLRTRWWIACSSQDVRAVSLVK